MQLRPYQQEAVDAVYKAIRTRDDNPCVVIPTGGGKTPVMATLCRDVVLRWGRRVLLLAHVKELLEQAADKLRRIAPDVAYGVYSAGLNSRDTKESVIIAGIQSVYDKACELGRFDLILIDESHLIPPSGEGRYQTFIRDAKVVNPKVRIVGLTATPYRMSSGMICSPDNILNHVCYEAKIKDLIRDGYLCRIHTKAPAKEIDCSGLHIRNGEFVASEVSELFDNEEAVRYVCRDISNKAKNRRGCLVFASSVAQATAIKNELARCTGETVGLVTGDTSSGERAELIARFRGGKIGLFQESNPLHWLVNVNVLTTGFDAPNVDCVAIARPTASPGLYYQMVGRGFRICKGKNDCLVLDYGNNIQRHGPVDAITVKTSGNGGGPPPMRKCPECGEIMSINISRCADCGYVFPIGDKPAKLDGTASRDGILSGQKTETEYEVRDVYYNVHVKKDAPPESPRTMRIDYEIGFNKFVSAWKCPEHPGWAWGKFAAWWKLRTDYKPPTDTEEAVNFGRNGYLAKPTKITVVETAGSRFPEIEEHDFTDKPVPPEPGISLTPQTCGDCIHYDKGECTRIGSPQFADDPRCDDYFTEQISEESCRFDDVPF